MIWFVWRNTLKMNDLFIKPNWDVTKDVKILVTKKIFNQKKILICHMEKINI